LPAANRVLTRTPARPSTTPSLHTRDAREEVFAGIAQELMDTIRKSVSIDWTKKEAVRAKLRTSVKRLLKRKKYPPDGQEYAVKTIIEQAEMLCRDWC